MTPSLLITNARVRTLSPETPECSAVQFAGGIVRWVGDAQSAPSSDRQVDAGGRVVIPGLIDTHAHLLWLAQNRLVWMLAGPDIRSLDDLVDQLRAKAAETPEDAWIVAFGINEYTLRESRLPTREELDRASTRHPILLRRFCGHTAVANTKALERAGINSASPDPSGGIFEREGGQLTGRLREAAAELLYRLCPAPDTEALANALDDVGRDYLALGVTGAVEAAVGFTNGFDAEWAVWSRLRQRGAYPLRMGFMLRLSPDEALHRDLSPGSVDPDWQVRTLKFFSDGILGSRTAALTRPYPEGGSDTGLAMVEPEQFVSDLRAASNAGWQVAVHAIGDRAIDLTAAALAEAGMSSRPALPRPRIEHLGLPSVESLRQLASMKAVIVTQHSFIRLMGDAFARVLGVDRAEALYPGRTLLDRGLTLAGSSDAPAGHLSPFVGMAASVDRRTVGGRIMNPGEALTPLEALETYTVGAAAALEQDGMRGRFRPGALADAVILDRDPLSCTADALAETEVEMTISRGEIAYSRRA